MTEINLDSILAPSEDIIIRNIQGETIIIPIDHRPKTKKEELFTLDAIGQIIWVKLQDKKSLREIIMELKEEFDDPDNTIQSDVLEFAEELLNRGILVHISAIS